MKVLIVLALAMAAIVLAVEGKPITIRGCLASDDRLMPKWVKVKVEGSETVGDLGRKLCQGLTGTTPLGGTTVNQAGTYSSGGLGESRTIGGVGLKDGERVEVNCSY